MRVAVQTHLTQLHANKFKAATAASGIPISRHPPPLATHPSHDPPSRDPPSPPQVVQALVKRSAHVPFRQSKLTAVLRDALGGNNKAAMVANVWPEVANLEETLSTLRFASRVRLLENDAVVNESSDPAFVIRKQERVIRELRQELAMRDTLAGRGVVAYDDMSDADVAELQVRDTGWWRGCVEWGVS